jgi:hypothetical protein
MARRAVTATVCDMIVSWFHFEQRMRSHSKYVVVCEETAEDVYSYRASPEEIEDEECDRMRRLRAQLSNAQKYRVQRVHT